MGGTHEHAQDDVDVGSTGSNFFLVAPLTERARAWVEEHVAAQTWFGERFVCEQRYVEDMVLGMIDEGMAVTRDGRALHAENGVVMMRT